MFPKSSESMRVSGSVAALRLTSGRRPPLRAMWTARATSSLPVPLAPTISTCPASGATNPIWWRISHAAGDSPTRPSSSGSPNRCDDTFAQRAGIQAGRSTQTNKSWDSHL